MCADRDPCFRGAAAAHTVAARAQASAGSVGCAGAEFAGIVKTGRTHLMDAMPITLGQQLGGWHSQIAACEARLAAVTPRLHALAQGGTA